MASSPLHEPGEQYDDRNNFLFFLLGLVSLSQSCLDRMADARTSSPAEAGGSPVRGETPFDLTGLLR